MKLIFTMLSLFMAVLINKENLFAQNKASQKVNYKIVKSAYFAHNYINEVSYFVFSSLKDFESKVGFACAGDCREDVKTALKEADFNKNIVAVIVHPDVPAGAKITIQEVNSLSKNKAIIKYTFAQQDKGSTYTINAIEILTLPKKYKDNVEFVKID